jgi:hypothetical protein
MTGPRMTFLGGGRACMYVSNFTILDGKVNPYAQRLQELSITNE